MHNSFGGEETSRVSQWADRRRDVLLVSSFGVWAAILGMGPLFVLRGLLLP